mmetsp:Transcript_75948/g.210881  ORF Transcript_75948/g.210881 Transcript_75948/m.210881 type:complete len:257 (-) Transcript_75948:713-1483(-)
MCLWHDSPRQWRALVGADVVCETAAEHEDEALFHLALVEHPRRVVAHAVHLDDAVSFPYPVRLVLLPHVVPRNEAVLVNTFDAQRLLIDLVDLDAKGAEARLLQYLNGDHVVVRAHRLLQGRGSARSRANRRHELLHASSWWRRRLSILAVRKLWLVLVQALRQQHAFAARRWLPRRGGGWQDAREGEHRRARRQGQARHRIFASAASASTPSGARRSAKGLVGVLRGRFAIRAAAGLLDVGKRFLLVDNAFDFPP